MSSITTAVCSRNACRHGPTPSPYWISSTCDARSSLQATVVNRLSRNKVTPHDVPSRPTSWAATEASPSRKVLSPVMANSKPVQVRCGVDSLGRVGCHPGGRSGAPAPAGRSSGEGTPRRRTRPLATPPQSQARLAMSSADRHSHAATVSRRPSAPLSPTDVGRSAWPVEMPITSGPGRCAPTRAALMQTTGHGFLGAAPRVSWPVPYALERGRPGALPPASPPKPALCAQGGGPAADTRGESPAAGPVRRRPGARHSGKEPDTGASAHD